MTSKDNLIYYTITAVVFIGIVVCSLLFHNPGQPTNGDSEGENISTIIIAFSPFVTAAATVILAFITRRYVLLTQEILKATNKPEVTIFLRFNRDRTISLRIENIGTGYASDVKFKGDLLSHKARPQFFGKEAQKIKELPPFKNGIPYLGSGHKIDTLPLFSIYVEEEDHIPKHAISITVFYKDSTGTPDDKTFFFEPRNWEDKSQFMSPHSDDISDELGRIAESLEDISNKPGNYDFYSGSHN